MEIAHHAMVETMRLRLESTLQKRRTLVVGEEAGRSVRFCGLRAVDSDRSSH